MKEFTIDMQRLDNGQQFSTSLLAPNTGRARDFAEIRFPESKVLIVWSFVEFAKPELIH
jgi:hypothetical protein